MQDKSLWEIFVHAYSNDGKEFPMEHHYSRDTKVGEISGELAILKTAKGQWTSPDGKIFFDKMIPVRIFCIEEEIDKIIQLTIKHYDQEAILAYEVSANVKLVYNNSKK